MAFLAGLGLAAALPPLHLLPTLVGLALLPELLLRCRTWRGALLVAWLMAFGYFLAGLYWVGIAFFAEAERFGALAVPGVVGLAAILATITGLVLSLAWLLFRARPWPLMLALAALWPISDMFRGAWGTQFPWNPLALVWSFSDSMLQLLAWIGVPGMSFATALIGMALGRALWHRLWREAGIVAALTIAMWIAGEARLDSKIVEEASGTRLRIVQAAIDQHHKWDPDKRRQWFERHLDLSMLPGEHDLLIWPESSVPYRLEIDPVARGMIASALGMSRAVLLGSDFLGLDEEPPILHNSVYVLDREGMIHDRYDKVDLVPFGEFLPFRTIFGALGLEALAVGSVDFRPGPGRRTLAIGDVPPFSPLVCFEIVFPGTGTDGTARPRWLLNLTNDAWFGISSGPYQHLDMARMRAVETGLPLVRAANTGISVVTDAYGRVLNRLPLGERGILDATLPPPLVSSPPVTAFPWLVWLLPTGAILLAAFLRGRTEVWQSRGTPRSDP